MEYRIPNFEITFEFPDDVYFEAPSIDEIINDEYSMNANNKYLLEPGSLFEPIK